MQEQCAALIPAEAKHTAVTCTGPWVTAQPGINLPHSAVKKTPAPTSSAQPARGPFPPCWLEGERMRRQAHCCPASYLMCAFKPHPAALQPLLESGLANLMVLGTLPSLLKASHFDWMHCSLGPGFCHTSRTACWFPFRMPCPPPRPKSARPSLAGFGARHAGLRAGSPDPCGTKPAVRCPDAAVRCLRMHMLASSFLLAATPASQPGLPLPAAAPAQPARPNISDQPAGRAHKPSSESQQRSHCHLSCCPSIHQCGWRGSKSTSAWGTGPALQADSKAEPRLCPKA